MAFYEKKGRWYYDFYPEGKSGKRVRLKLPDTVTTREEAAEIAPSFRQIYVDRMQQGYDKVDDLDKMFDSARYHFERNESTIIADGVSKIITSLVRFCREHNITEYNLLEPSPNFLEYYSRKRAEVTNNKAVNRELYHFELLHNFLASEGHCAPISFDIHRLYLKDRTVKRHFSEKFHEKLIERFPEYFLEEGLTSIKKPSAVSPLIPDSLFIDEKGSYVVVEIQKHRLDRGHAYKILEYRDKLEHSLAGQNINIRMMVVVIGDECPIERQTYLKKYGVELVMLPIDKVEKAILAIIDDLSSSIEYQGSVSEKS